MLYLDQVILEVLCFCGFVFFFGCSCEEDIVIKGVWFFKGIDVNIFVYVLYWDFEVWDNLFEFNLENFFFEVKGK